MIHFNFVNNLISHCFRSSSAAYRSAQHIVGAPLRFVRITSLLTLLMVSGNAWGWRGARVNVASLPSNGGYVWVTKTNGNAPSKWEKTSDSSEQSDGHCSDKYFDFYLYAHAQANYRFVGWWSDNKIVSNNATNEKVSVKADGCTVSYNEYQYYAIFARMTSDVASGSTLDYGKINVGNSGTTTIKLTHAYANISYTFTGTNAADFSASPVPEASITEVESSVTITFTPSGSGIRTATLTIKGGNGLSDITYNLKGTAYTKPSIIWKDGDGNQITSESMTLCIGDILKATCSTQQSISYSDYADYFNAETIDNERVLRVKSIISGTFPKVTIKATLAEDATSYIAEYTESFTLGVTSLTPQIILWTDDISDMDNSKDFPYTVSLTAVALNAKTKESSGQTITYTCQNVNATDTKEYISVSGTTLTIKDIGGPTKVTASAEGNTTTYAPATAVKYVTVSDIKTACAESDSHDDGSFDHGGSHTIYPVVGDILKFDIYRPGGLYHNFCAIQYNEQGKEITRDTYDWEDLERNTTTHKEITLNASTNYVVFQAEESANYTYKVQNIISTRKTTVSKDAESLAYEAIPGQSYDKTLKITYSNVPVYLTLGKGKSSNWTLGTTKVGGCSKRGYQNVIVTFSSNVKGDNFSDVLYLKSNTGVDWGSVNLSAVVTGKQQFLDTWNIKDAYDTKEQVTLSAKTTNNVTDFTFTAYKKGTTEASDIVSINNQGVMTFTGSGTATIKAYQEGNDEYAEFSTTHDIAINKSTPTISTNPTATITYGKTLSTVSPSGGAATITLHGQDNQPVEGSFVWKDGTTVVTKTAGAQTYPVVFNPKNTAMYKSVEGVATVTVNRADLTLTVSNGYVNVSTNTTSPTILDLSTLLTSTSVGGRTISYEITSENKADATVVTGTSNFYAIAAGTYTIKATAAQSDYYKASYATFTVTVNRIDGQQISWVPSDKTTFLVGETITANGATGSTVTLSASGEGAKFLAFNDAKTIATVTDVYESGTFTVTLTANASATSVYNATSSTNEISITSKQRQTITWSQTFDQLKLGTTVDALNATATAGACTYTSSNSSVVSVSGTTLTIVGEGTATLTASNAGNDTYAPVSMTKFVMVSDPTKVCPTSISLQTAKIDLGSKYDQGQSITFEVKTPSSILLEAEQHSGILESDKLTISQEVNGAWSDVYSETLGTDSYTSITLTNVSVDATNIKISTDGYFGYKVQKVSYTRNTNFTISKTELSFSTTPNTKPADQTITASYHNVKANLSLGNGENSHFTISPSTIGDCGDYGDNQVITIGYKAQSAACTDEEVLYFKDVAGNTLKTCTLKAEVTKLPQVINHNVIQAYKTTNKVTITPTAQVDGFTYEISDQSVSGMVELIGNVMTFAKSGTFTLTIKQAGNGVYEAASVTIKDIVVSKDKPTLTAPTAATITYGQKLSESALTGGSAMVSYQGMDNTPVEGQFVWSEPDAVKTANKGATQQYQVTFNPTSTDMYEPATINVDIIINRAVQTLTWTQEIGTQTYNESLELQAQGPKTGGTIRYTIDKETIAQKTVNNNKVKFVGVGDVIITASADESDDYEATTATANISRTISVQKATPTIEWNNISYYYNTTYPISSLYKVTYAGDECEFSMTSSEKTIADVQGTNLKVFDNAGTTTLTLTSAEKDYWKETTFTKDITPSQPSNHVTFTYNEDMYNSAAITTQKTSNNTSWVNQSGSDYKYVRLGNTDSEDANAVKYVVIHFYGIPDKISFNHSTSNDISSANWTITESTDGESWTDVWSSTHASTQWLTSDIVTNMTQTSHYVKLAFKGAYAGDYMNVTISEKQQYETNVSELNFGAQLLNHPTTKAFTLTHCNAGYNTTITAPTGYQISLDNANWQDEIVYSSNDNPITGGDLYGAVVVYVKYLAASEGTHNGDIVVQNDVRGDITVAVKGSTQGKLHTTIYWDDNVVDHTKTFSEADGTIANPFIVKDDNGNKIEGAKATFWSENSNILLVNVDETTKEYTFTTKCGGDVKVYANYQDVGDTYAPVKDQEFTVHVTKCSREIIWTNEFGYRVADETKLPFTDTQQSFNAVLSEGSGDIEYTIADEEIAEIVTIEGKKYLKLLKHGDTRITATVAENTTYKETSDWKDIVVSFDGDQCTSYLLKPQTAEFTSTTPTYTISDGPGSTLTFYAKASVLIGTPSITIYYYKGDETSSTKGSDYTLDEEYGEQKSWTIPDGVKRFYFQTSGTRTRYIKDLQVRQDQYINLSGSDVVVVSKDENTYRIAPTKTIYVGDPCTFDVVISYSDIQNPTITRKTNNSNVSYTTTLPSVLTCGKYNDATLSITVNTTKMTEKDTPITETFTISDANGDFVATLNMSITVSIGGYFCSKKDGNWSDKTLWVDEVGNAKNDVPDHRDIVIVKEGNLQVDVDDAEAYRVYMDNATGRITINPTGGLTVYGGGVGDLTATNCTIQSSTDNQGYFRMLPIEGNTMPSATVEFATKATLDYGANDAAIWQYFGIPVDEDQINVDYITWFSHWDNSSNGWDGGKNNCGNVDLAAWNGYCVTQYGKPTYTWEGQLLNGTVTCNLGASAGEKMIANSFAAPIDVKKFTKKTVTTEADYEGIDGSFYIFNAGSHEDWESHIDDNDKIISNMNHDPGSFTVIPIKTAIDLDQNVDQTMIAPMQAICVRATAANAWIKFDYAKHVWAATSDKKSAMTDPIRVPSRMYEDSLLEEEDTTMVEPDTLIHRVRLLVYGANSGADHMYLLERNTFTADYDNGCDAYRMEGSSGIPAIYANESFGQTIVSATNNVDSMYLGFQAGEDNEYKLFVTSLIGEPMYLLDTKTDAMLLMDQDTTLTFTAEPNSRDDFRFRILKQTESDDNPTITGWFNKEAVSDARMWVARNMLYVADAPASARVYVYSVNGQLIHTQSFSRNVALPISHLPKGCYMAKVGNTIYKFVK